MTEEELFEEQERDEEERDILASVQEKSQIATDPSEVYTEQYQIAKSKLLTSDFKNIVLELIYNSTLTYSCKSALTYVVNYGFDKNSVLAKTTDIDMKKIDFEIALNTAKLAYKKTDVYNPELPVIEETIKRAYYDFSSRSKDGWERGLQNVQQVSSDTTITRKEIGKDGKPIEKKRGFNFLNPFGG